MSARDKLYAYAGTPSVLPESMLDAALDAYRNEVLAEAADELNRIADIVEAGQGPAQMLRDVAGNVRYMARQNTHCPSRPTASEPTPGFFQPDHTYTANVHADIVFDCLTVSAEPNNGRQVAIGWRYGPPRDGSRPVKLAALDAAAFACCDWSENHAGGAK